MASILAKQGSSVKLAAITLLFVVLLAAPAVPCSAAAKSVTLTVEGQPLAALYWLPARTGGGKAPAAILLHMLGRSKEDWRGFGDELERSGYAALAVDLRGGANAGERKLVGDARAAFDFLVRQSEVDAARISVVGASIGANGALLFAVEEPRMRCAVLLSPGLEYHGVSTVPAISKMTRPVLLVASEDDQYSAQTVRRLNQLAPGPKALKMYSHAGHGTEIFAAGVGLDKEILAFLKSHL